jgi:hypothetical protein
VALRSVGEDVLAARAGAAGLDARTRYWTPAVQRAAFALPRWIGELVRRGRSEAAAGPDASADA